MSTSTEFLNLVKPSQNDTVDVSVFNNNADILDAKLSEINTALEESSSSAGGVSAEEISEIRNMIKHLEDVQTGIFEPRNLALIFADEIASFSDDWAWIKNRATNGNYTGLQIGDYLDVVSTQFGTIRYMIGAFDHYYQTSYDNSIGHHIVMVPSTPIEHQSTYIHWGNGSSNNTSNPDKTPYTDSKLHNWEINTFLSTLPTKVKSALLSFSWSIEDRYNYPETLTDSEYTKWISVGKVFSPSEIEVFGSRIFGSSCTNKLGERQFPIFAKTKIAESASQWWLRTISGYDSNNACISSWKTPSLNAVDDGAFPRPCLLVG